MNKVFREKTGLDLEKNLIIASFSKFRTLFFVFEKHQKDNYFLLYYIDYL